MISSSGFGPGFLETVGHGFDVIGNNALQGHPGAGDGRGNEESARFDAVGNHGVLRAVQFFYPLDDDPSGARAFDLGAHGVEEIRKVDNFGFRGGSLDNSGPLGKSGGHHDVVGSKHCRAEFAAQVDDRAL